MYSAAADASGLRTDDYPPGVVCPDEIVLEEYILRVSDRCTVYLQCYAVVIGPDEGIPDHGVPHAAQVYAVTVQYPADEIYVVDCDMVGIVYGHCPVWGIYYGHVLDCKIIPGPVF